MGQPGQEGFQRKNCKPIPFPRKVLPVSNCLWEEGPFPEVYSVLDLGIARIRQLMVLMRSPARGDGEGSVFAVGGQR